MIILRWPKRIGVCELVEDSFSCIARRLSRYQQLAQLRPRLSPYTDRELASLRFLSSCTLQISASTSSSDTPFAIASPPGCREAPRREPPRTLGDQRTLERVVTRDWTPDEPQTTETMLRGRAKLSGLRTCRTSTALERSSVRSERCAADRTAETEMGSAAGG